MSRGRGEVGEFWWHVHHDRIAEPLYEPVGVRRDYISAVKPAHERGIRLEFMTPVIGRLPAEFVVPALHASLAWQRWLALRSATEVLREHLGIRISDFTYGDLVTFTSGQDKGLHPYLHLYHALVDLETQMLRVREDAAQADTDTRVALKQPDARRAIEYLHEKEHGSRCPWNGFTLFPGPGPKK